MQRGIAAMEAGRLATILSHDDHWENKFGNQSVIEEALIQAAEAHERIGQFLAEYGEQRRYRYTDWIRNRHNAGPIITEVNAVRRHHGLPAIDESREEDDD